MLNLILPALIVVMTAIVYTEVLTAPGMILGWWDKWLHNRVKSDWILKPLGDCAYCFGGQLALWSYLFLGVYSFWEHFAYIIFVIFIIHIYKQLNGT